MVSDEIQLTNNNNGLQGNSWTKVLKSTGYSSMLSIERFSSGLGSSIQNLFLGLSSSSELGYNRIEHENMSPHATSELLRCSSDEKMMNNKVDCLPDSMLQHQ